MERTKCVSTFYRRLSLFERENMKPKNTHCYTRCIAMWKCPYCRKDQETEVSTEYPEKEEVKCDDCKRTVLITEG